MREAVIERYLKARVEQHGGTCEKFVTPGKRGAQDRLVCWPALGTGLREFYHPAQAHFIEVKRPKKFPTDQQERNAKKRLAMGFYASFVNSHFMVDRYIHKVCHQRGLIYIDPPCPEKWAGYTS